LPLCRFWWHEDEITPPALVAFGLNQAQARSTILVSSIPHGGNMPHYEFFCLDCKKFFSKILSLIDYEEGGVVCPRCRSKNVEQRWSAFTVITSKKSA